MLKIINSKFAKGNEQVEIVFREMDGDFSIDTEHQSHASVQINKGFIEKALFIVTQYLIQNNTSGEKINILINQEGYTFNLDSAISLYLNSFNFMKEVNYILYVDNAQQAIFDDITAKLKTIKEIKNTMCKGDSNILKEHLLGYYDLFSSTAQKIIDKTYPKEPIDFMGKKVFIVDNHNFFHRTYHGMPDMRDSQNRPTNIIKALTILVKDIISQDVDYVIFANEGTRTKNVRKDIYPDYKINRSKTPDDLSVQIQICLDLLKKMKFNVIEVEGYEADDVIASYSKSFSDAGASVVVYTSDKDLFQILAGDNNINILHPTTKKFITVDDCLKKFKVTFDKCLMVQALMGDSSDDVPGIKGIGAGAASELINQYHTLDEVYKNADSIPGKKGEKIRDGKEDAYISLQLVSMNDTLATIEEMEKSIMPDNPLSEILDELSKYEIHV